MPALKLHLKTTLLASLITVGTLAVALVLTSARIANLERNDDKVLAETQARDLSQHISDMRPPRDIESLTRAADLIKDSRPNIISVRYWERDGDEFVEKIAANNSAPANPIPLNIKRSLLDSGSATDTEKSQSQGDPLFRVFEGTFSNGKLNGAVEIVERFDSIGTVVLRYLRSAIGLSLIAVALITLSSYLLFRRLVYQPLERLLRAMSRAKKGDLEAHVAANGGNEIGLLTEEFNSMITQVREMTMEREAQQNTLRERVKEATNELEKRNQQLQETNLELWRTNRRMNELGRLAAAGQTAAQFAHEVGTPLNLISGHVQLLRSDLERDPRDAESRIKTISAQIERIERIVRRMLDKTRFETELSPLDLNMLLLRLCEAMSPAFSKRDIRLVTDFADDLPSIAGSADRLQQLFLNLINNSLDAMPNGGELNITTHTALTRKDRSLQVVVDFSDTGSGMTPEILGHIFDPLYTTKDRGHGTGLGLVIVSQIISEHGGKIEVHSEPGEGTRFRLEFVAMQAELSTNTGYEPVELNAG